MSHFFGPGGESPPAAWHPEPNFRGTWNVLSTCVLTMLLCIWTAVHLNIPDQERKHLQKWRKCGALITGLLAPELVAWNAWEQRQRVRKLTKDVRNLKQRSPRSSQCEPAFSRRSLRSSQLESVLSRRSSRSSQLESALSRRSSRSPGCEPELPEDVAKNGYLNSLRDLWRAMKVTLLLEPGKLKEDNFDSWPPDVQKDLLSAWTDAHSWYALMGGFAFDTSSAEKPFLPGGRKVLTLTGEGVLLILEHLPHLLPQLTEEMVKNQGNSDSLSKVITCWQAAWFCFQCISRLAQGLSICLLELNVFGHAICALLIYAIWWNKPKDVEEPTRLTGEDSNSIAALLSTFDGEGAANSSWNFNWTPSEPKIGYDKHSPRLPVEVYSVRALLYPNCIDIGGSIWSITGHGYSPERAGDAYENDEKTYSAVPTTVSVDQLTARRLTQIRHRDLMLELIKDSTHAFETHEYVHKTAPRNRLVSFDTLEGEVRWIVQRNLFPWYVLSMAIATCFYGGLHAVAWDAGFPSATERLLWRASSMTVALSGVGFICVFVVYLWTRASVKTAKDAEGIKILSRLWQGCFGKAPPSFLPSPTPSWQKDMEDLGAKIRDEAEFRRIYGRLWVEDTDLYHSVPKHLRERKSALLWKTRRQTNPNIATVKYWIQDLAILLPLLWYTLCRGFLVVESFINVAHLSEADLKLPTWSQYVPHVT